VTPGACSRGFACRSGSSRASSCSGSPGRRGTARDGDRCRTGWREHPDLGRRAPREGTRSHAVRTLQVVATPAVCRVGPDGRRRRHRCQQRGRCGRHRAVPGCDGDGRDPHEEAFLRARFGPEYDDYCRGAGVASQRPSVPPGHGATASTGPSPAWPLSSPSSPRRRTSCPSCAGAAVREFVPPAAPARPAESRNPVPNPECDTIP